MAKIKDLANLREGDRIIINDPEYQLFDVEGLVRDTLIPDTDGVEWVRVQCYIGDSHKIVTVFQSDVVDGTTTVEKID